MREDRNCISKRTFTKQVHGRRERHKDSLSHEIKEINKLRRLLELPLLLSVKQKRKCLRCEKAFISEGNHNRMCDRCGSHYTE